MFCVNPPGDRFVDRGDPDAYDFLTGDFIKDGNWHDLDLSGIISPGTKMVIIRIGINVTSLTAFLYLRKNGTVNLYNEAICKTDVVGQSQYFDVHVAVDANGIIEYRCTTANISALNFIVRGWIV